METKIDEIFYLNLKGENEEEIQDERIKESSAFDKMLFGNWGKYHEILHLFVPRTQNTIIMMNTVIQNHEIIRNCSF